MSDDLISRKALITDMRNRKYIDKALCEIFETVVDEAPTAFDKEKVIEELQQDRDERLKNWEENLFWNENRREEGIIKGLSIAIGVVEKGGLN